MLAFYKALTGLTAPLLRATLHRRAARGKEDPARLAERTGMAGKPRPQGPLLWLHAASVGEAQSTLALVNSITGKHPQLSLLITSGTVTSARLLEKRLPPQVIHQFYPLDHPAWVQRFLDHWRPDLALWMESEIWPNMLDAIKARDIPAVLINARLSPRSFRRWKVFSGSAAKLLGTFSLCLMQTEEDAQNFKALGAQNVTATDNLKYAAAPLPFEAHELTRIHNEVKDRPLWVYASTHEGEEALACRIHKNLRETLPGLLTIIVPRHPERRNLVIDTCHEHGLEVRARGENRTLPEDSDDIYLVDTLGELGLFYNLAPLACIGRSFSKDGGGGHNPIEAAQLECAVLHGPHVQNLAAIYEAFDRAGAAKCLADEADFAATLETLLKDDAALKEMRAKAAAFCRDKAMVLDRVIDALTPFINAIDQKQQRACA